MQQEDQNQQPTSLKRLSPQQQQMDVDDDDKERISLAKRKRSDAKCPICLQAFKDIAIIKACRHRFCFNCITKWISQRPNCPLCKQRVDLIKHEFRRSSAGEPDWEEQGLTVTAREVIEEEDFRRISEHTWSLTGELELIDEAIKQINSTINRAQPSHQALRLWDFSSELTDFRKKAARKPRSYVIRHTLFRFVVYYMDADRQTLVTTHTDVNLTEQYVRENRTRLRSEWLAFVAREIYAITGLQAIDIDRLMELILNALESPERNKEALFSHLKSIGVDHPRTFYKHVQSFGSSDQSIELYDANSRYKIQAGLGPIFTDDSGEVQVITPPEDEEVQFVGVSRTNQDPELIVLP